MNSEVIKSFLVGLGFDVDDASLRSFNRAIAGATVKVAALYGAVQLATAAIVKSISDVSGGFEQMGYEYRIIAPAINKTLILRRALLQSYAAAGINITRTVQDAVRLNLSLTKTKYAFEAIYKSVASKFFGLLTKQSDSLRKQLFQNMPKIQKYLERFVKFTFKAFEATYLLGKRAFSILGRVYDFFAKLHETTNGWSTAILAAAAAWRILNLSFLLSPLGLIISGLTAILLLYDDFKTYQEGGQSLINWGKYIPALREFKAVMLDIWEAVKSLYAVFDDLGDTLDGVIKLFDDLGDGNWDAVFADLKSELQTVLKLLTDIWGAAGKVGNSLFNAFNWAGNGLDKLLGVKQGSGIFDPSYRAGALANVGANAASFIGPPAPVSSSVVNQGGSTSSQTVKQQTNISVTSTADASHVGAAIAGQQTRVNGDMVRNLRGAVRQ